MVKTESCKNHEASAAVSNGRRVFLTWLGAAVAFLCQTSWPTIALTAIPTPRYIPEGYSFVGEYRGEPDGFRTGNSEIKFAYANRKLWGKIFSPLFIFVSPMTDNRFAGLVDHVPESIALRIGNENVEGEYFDGFWMNSPDGERIAANGERAHWDTSNLNALVFPFDGYMIGILGSKPGGVDRSQLIRIASSFGPLTK